MKSSNPMRISMQYFAEGASDAPSADQPLAENAGSAPNQWGGGLFLPP
ncbi:MAG TPA: hypothetical protein PLM59_02055 [Oscillospiraceae bacterium]|nr:hypothetical protein [Oscillospiraceae bacterium]